MTRTRTDQLGPLEPIFKSSKRSGSIVVGNTPGVQSVRLDLIGSDDSLLVADSFGIAVSGGHAFTASQADDRVVSFDIDPAASLFATDNVTDSVDLNSVADLILVGSYLFCAVPIAGKVTSIDVTDPTAMVVEDTETNATMAGINKIGADGNAAVVGRSGAIDTIDISTPTSIAYGAALADASRFASPSHIEVIGSTAYVTSADWFTIVDISTLASPSITGSLNDATNIDAPRGFRVSGDYAYIVNETGTLTIIDISTPATPVFEATLSSLGTLLDVELSTDHAYVVGDSTAAIIDISDPSSPSLVTSTLLMTSGALQAVERSGVYLVCAATDGDADIVILEIVGVTL